MVCIDPYLTPYTKKGPNKSMILKLKQTYTIPIVWRWGRAKNDTKSIKLYGLKEYG